MKSQPITAVIHFTLMVITGSVISVTVEGVTSVIMATIVVITFVGVYFYLTRDENKPKNEVKKEGKQE